MNRLTLRVSSLAVGLGLAFLAGAVSAAEVPPTVPVVNTTFAGTLVYLGDYGPTGATTTLRVHVNRLNPAEDADRFAELLEKQGESALESKLGSGDMGYLQIGDRFPERLAAAFLEETGGVRHLVLITERPFSARELFGSFRSADYRFRVIELTFDLEGKGSGEMLPAARLRLEEDGSLGARNLDVLPSRILGFRALTA